MSKQEIPSSYDLHLHTYWSYDGIAHPESYFKRARELGVRCLAITEHHVVDSWPEIREMAGAYPEVRAVPSAEITVDTSMGEMDLLCFGFPEERTPELQRLLDTYHEWQRARGSAESGRLCAKGFDYGEERRMELLRTYRPEKVLAVQGATRVKNQIQHRYFVERGFVAREEDARALLSEGDTKIPMPPYPRAEDVIPVLKKSGVWIALAHPNGYFRKYDEPRMDALREELALDGIECAHPSVPWEFTERYRGYCKRHGLFSTGGSDNHLSETIQKHFAFHGGPDDWLEEFLERLGT